ncbi:cytochrome c oxidase assembly protein, partial [Rubripirellula sp.]|nr:cytochrome c oxidase assembly protein [Rubripirellula sp.]
LVLSLPPSVDRTTRAVVIHDGSLRQSMRRLIMSPIAGWSLGLGAMWFWHVPAFCSAATENYMLGVLRTGTFLASGVFFWWPIYAPLKQTRLPASNAVVYLFSACLGCTLLGIYITFTTVTVCPAFASPQERLAIMIALHDAGMTASVDQQLGGLLMWVPPCSLYVAAIVSVLCRWYAVDPPGEVGLSVPQIAEMR